MTCPHPTMCLLEVLMVTHNFERFRLSKNFQKGAWLGTFQPNWQNHKIGISLTENIGSTPNFDSIVDFVGGPE